MIKTLHPYTNTAKTAEIMSRYRPIAPKPETPENSVNESSSMSQKIRQSPYLRNLWPQLQARPTRTRKRGRAALSPPALKRPRTHHIFGLSAPSPVASQAKNLSLQGFGMIPQLSVSVPNLAATVVTCGGGLENPTATTSGLVTLPLLPCSPSAAKTQELSCLESGKAKEIDLNRVVEVPEEKNLVLQLQSPPTSPAVISPQPVRPVGSRISVGCINEELSTTLPGQVPKLPEEVEEEVESESLPAVISDSNNKVRLANSAYKEMVGQPECPWLDSMVTEGKTGAHSCKRICGEVMLHLSESRVPVHLEVPYS